LDFPGWEIIRSNRIERIDIMWYYYPEHPGHEADMPETAIAGVTAERHTDGLFRDEHHPERLAEEDTGKE
jgi:hypothetical protein